MTDTTATGLDALVEEAMGRKLIPQRGEPPVPLKEDGPVEVVPGKVAPDLSLAFAVNGVKVIVTVHVEAGAVITTPSAPRKATQSAPKVKGIRGASQEENAAPEQPVRPTEEEVGFPTKENLPEGWEYDETVGARPISVSVQPEAGQTESGAWKCPVHGTSEVKVGAKTGRTRIVCGQCDQMAPA